MEESLDENGHEYAGSYPRVHVGLQYVCQLLGVSQYAEKVSLRKLVSLHILVQTLDGVLTYLGNTPSLNPRVLRKVPEYHEANPVFLFLMESYGPVFAMMVKLLFVLVVCSVFVWLYRREAKEELLTHRYAFLLATLIIGLVGCLPWALLAISFAFVELITTSYVWGVFDQESAILLIGLPLKEVALISSILSTLLLIGIPLLCFWYTTKDLECSQNSRKSKFGVLDLVCEFLLIQEWAKKSSFNFLLIVLVVFGVFDAVLTFYGLTYSLGNEGNASLTYLIKSFGLIEALSIKMLVTVVAALGLAAIYSKLSKLEQQFFSYAALFVVVLYGVIGIAPWALVLCVECFKEIALTFPYFFSPFSLGPIVTREPILFTKEVYLLLRSGSWILFPLLLMHLIRLCSFRKAGGV